MRMLLVVAALGFAMLGSVMPPFIGHATVEIISTPHKYDGGAHIIIGPEVVFYIKVFCWVVGAMFGALSLTVCGIGFFLKRTMDKYEGTMSSQGALLADHQTTISRILSEHDMRGHLCPGLHPDILRNAVSAAIGIAMPGVWQHCRTADPMATPPHHHVRRETKDPMAQDGAD